MTPLGDFDNKPTQKKEFDFITQAGEMDGMNVVSVST